MRASAVLLVPLVAGWIWFQATAEPQAQGVYVEVADGTFRLPDCLGSANVAVVTPVLRGRLLAFYRIGGGVGAAPVPSARIFLRAVNYSQPDVVYDPTPVDTRIHRLNPDVVRIAPAEPLQWDPEGLPNSVLRHALAQIAVRRSATELIAEVDFGEAGGCRYGVALGPPSQMPSRALGWYVPPPGAQR